MNQLVSSRFIKSKNVRIPVAFFQAFCMCAGLVLCKWHANLIVFFPANVRLCISSLFLFVWKCAVNARHSNAIIKFSTRQITGRSTISGIGWFAMQISCKFLQIQKSAPFKFFFLTKIELNLNETMWCRAPSSLWAAVNPAFGGRAIISVVKSPALSLEMFFHQPNNIRETCCFLFVVRPGGFWNKQVHQTETIRLFWAVNGTPHSNEWIGSWSWKPTILDFYFN